MARGTEKSNWRVQFHPVTGDHLSYDSGSVYNPRHDPTDPSSPRVLDTDERPATYTFQGVLKVVGSERGRSAVNIILQDTRGRKYSMTFSEFMRLLPEMAYGAISGTWGFAKNGSNTGLVRVD